MIIVVFVISCFVGCIAAKRNVIRSCHNYAVNSKYLSYKIVKYYDNTSDTSTVYMNDNNICLCVKDTYFYNLDRYQFILIDRKREDYITCNKNYHSSTLTNLNWYQNYVSEFKGMCSEDLYSKFWNTNLSKNIVKKTDAVYKNKKYELYYVKSENYNVLYRYSAETGLIDKITYTTNNPKDKVTYEYRDFSFEDNRAIINSIFSDNNPRWAKLVRCNDTNLPTSRVIFTEDKDTVITDVVKKFPLVNINNDTTTIAQQDNWLFLFCWCYTCVPCVEFAEKLQQEKQQYGQTILESNGIKIMCLNYHAADITKLKNFVRPYNDVSNLFFGAKGINKYLQMVKLPTYYLISPDKKTVYVGTGKIENYDKILKRKAEYEKHK